MLCVGIVASCSVTFGRHLQKRLVFLSSVPAKPLPLAKSICTSVLYNYKYLNAYLKLEGDNIRPEGAPNPASSFQALQHPDYRLLIHFSPVRFTRGAARLSDSKVATNLWQSQSRMLRHMSRIPLYPLSSEKILVYSQIPASRVHDPAAHDLPFVF